MLGITRNFRRQKADAFAMKHVGVFSPRKHLLDLLLVEVIILFVGNGCAWRMGRSEHYLGPTFFCSSEQDNKRENVVQVRQVGVFGEGGRQWGIGIGVSDWLAATPQVLGEAEVHTNNKEMGPSGGTSFRLLSPLVIGRWNLSLLYLRREKDIDPSFVRRATYGAMVLVGREVNAMSVGIITRTWLWPPHNSLAVLRFDDRFPLDMRFVVWNSRSEKELPVSEILKEDLP